VYVVKHPGGVASLHVGQGEGWEEVKVITQMVSSCRLFCPPWLGKGGNSQCLSFSAILLSIPFLLWQRTKMPEGKGLCLIGMGMLSTWPNICYAFIQR